MNFGSHVTLGGGNRFCLIFRRRFTTIFTQNRLKVPIKIYIYVRRYIIGKVLLYSFLNTLHLPCLIKEVKKYEVRDEHVKSDNDQSLSMLYVFPGKLHLKVIQMGIWLCY